MHSESTPPKKPRSKRKQKPAKAKATAGPSKSPQEKEPKLNPRHSGTKALIDYCERMHRIFSEQQDDPDPTRKFITVKELAERFELSASTVKRFLEFMRDRLRLPAWHIRERGGQGYTEKVFAFPLHAITEGEIFLFILAKRAFGEGTPFAEKFEPLCDKIAAALQKDEVDLKKLESVVHFHQSGLDAPMKVCPELWDFLAMAATGCEELQCMHLKAEVDAVPTKRVLYPLAISEIGNGWYLWAIEPNSAEPFPKKFALSRLSQVEKTGRIFTPIAFDPKAELKDSLGVHGGKAVKVHLRLTGRSAQLVGERKVHDSQEFERQADGSLDLWMEVAENPELENWIMLRGGDVEVLEPRSLREKIYRLHMEGAQKNG